MKSQMAKAEQLPSEKPELDSTVAEEEKFSLYVRGAAWIKDRENAANRLKEIEPRIQDVRHPRQKSADYCFIDFESALDRDQSYEKLNAHPDFKVKAVTKDVPRLLEKRRQKIDEKRAAKKETRKLIAQIKKKDKSNAKPVEKTNQIVILNVPKHVTKTDLTQQYPNATKIAVRQVKKNMKKSTAIITFPNPHDAFVASEAEAFNLHGHKINVRLNTSKLFKRSAKNKATKRKSDVSDGTREPLKKCPKTETIEKSE